MNNRKVAIPCPVCNLPDAARFRLQQQIYPIWRCGACEVQFVYPQPSESDLKKIYTSSYFQRGEKYGKGTSDSLPLATRLNEKAKVDSVCKHRSQGSLLDVGCATGSFLSEAQKHGFTGVGVEISAEAGRLAREQYGLRVHNDLFSTELTAGSFDIVTLWDVVEHLASPSRVLRRAHELLKPGGVLILTTGDVSSWWARITGRRWPLLTPPQHLFFFTPQSMRVLVRDAGFEGVNIAHSVGKYVHGKLLSLKMSESFGMLGRFFASLSRSLGLDKKAYFINLGDLMVVAAHKPREDENG
jgi:SAM-dependent methyltransferase